MKNWLKFLNLENALILAILFLPLYVIRLNFFGLPINVLEILITLIFFHWIFSPEAKKQFYSFFQDYSNPFFALLSLIFIGFIIAIWQNPLITKNLGILKSWLFFPLLFFFLCSAIIPTEKKKNLLVAYFFSCLGVASIALFYYATGSLTYDDRLEAFFNSPNYLAMYLSPGIIIYLAGFLKSAEFKKNLNLEKTFFWIEFSLIIISTALYLTFSYAAWLAVFLSSLPLFFLSRKISWGKAGLFLALLFGLVFSQLENPKFQKIAELDARSSLSSRLMIWRSTIELIKDNFFSGLGLANFQNSYLEYQKFFPPYLEWTVPHPHNVYLAFWLSAGLVGFLGFLGMIFFFLKTLCARKEWSFFNLAALGIMLYILIHGFFDTTYFKNDLAILFWLISLATKKQSSSSKMFSLVQTQK